MQPGPYSRLEDVAVAFDPSRGDFAVAGLYDDGALAHRIVWCERTAGSWACTPVAEPAYYVGGIALACGAEGTAFLAYTVVGSSLFVAVRDPLAGGGWEIEAARWNAYSNRPDLRLAPDGRPAVAYRSANDATGAGGSDGNCSVSLAVRSPAP